MCCVDGLSVCCVDGLTISCHPVPTQGLSVCMCGRLSVCCVDGLTCVYPRGWGSPEEDMCVDNVWMECWCGWVECVCVWMG